MQYRRSSPETVLTVLAVLALLAPDGGHRISIKWRSGQTETIVQPLLVSVVVRSALGRLGARFNVCSEPHFA
jgi:hypothetical protein